MGAELALRFLGPLSENPADLKYPFTPCGIPLREALGGTLAGTAGDLNCDGRHSGCTPRNAGAKRTSARSW